MLNKIVQSIKDGHTNYDDIIDFVCSKKFSSWTAKERKIQLAQLEALLAEQPANEENVWIMATFKINNLLDKTLRKTFPEKIDLNFCPSTSRAISTITYLVSRKLWTSVQYVLSNFEKFTQINWNAAPTEGRYKDISVFWLLAICEQWGFVKQILSSKLQLIAQINWNVAPTEGPHRGISVFWWLAFYKQWELIKQLLNSEPQLIAQIEWNAATIKGFSEGKSVIWWLAFYEQRELIKQILNSKPQLITHIEWNAMPTEGSNKGISVFWLLAGNQQWDPIKQILNSELRLIVQINWNAEPTQGPDKGVSVFWWLSFHERYDLIKQILNLKPQLIAQINWNAAPTEEPYKGTSVWKLMVQNQQWVFIELIVANPTLLLQHLEENNSIYADLLRCDDLQQRTRLIKTYLLSNVNPEPIPDTIKTQILPYKYQQELENNFEAVATMLNDWDENNFFETAPLELHEIVLKNFLYEIDPDLVHASWQQLQSAFYNYLDKRRDKFQKYACRAITWHACRFFQEQYAYSPQELAAQNIHECKLPNKVTVAGWIAETLDGVDNQLKLYHPHRKKLLTQLKLQPALTEETVRLSFYQTFKPTLFKHCEVLKKQWDMNIGRDVNGMQDNVTEDLDQLVDKLAKRPGLDLLKNLLSNTKSWLSKVSCDQRYYQNVLSLKRNLEEALLKESPQCLDLLEPTIKALEEFIEHHHIAGFEKIQFTMKTIFENKSLQETFKTQSRINLIYIAKTIAELTLKDSNSSPSSTAGAAQSEIEKIFLHKLSELSLYQPELLQSLLSFLKNNSKTPPEDLPRPY